jgi:DnaJ like chaperone protein
MTIWHRLSDAAAGTLAGDTLKTLLQRLGLADGHAELSAAGPEAVQSSRFSIAIIALSAKLARSDGAVTADEVAAFRRIMDVPAGEEANVRRLFDLAKRDVAGFEAYARQVGDMLAGDAMLIRDVMNALFVIAAADGVLHDKEDQYLCTVGRLIGMSEAAYRYERGLVFAAPMGPYAVLDLQPDASDRALKSRYRDLVREHHPDRLAGLGCTPEFVARAERKLARINAAYDAIARERGL